MDKIKKGIAKPVNLFWTGGWDSTFELLNLLLTYKRTVQPIYVIDETRKSLMAEFQTMRDIKNALFTEYPYTKQLILPTRFFALSDIPPNENITAIFNRIIEKTHVGIQYEWLARFCEWQNLNDIELSVQAEGRIDSLVKNETIYVNDGNREVLQLGRDFKEKDVYSIFRYYTFPVLKYSKIDMKKVSEAEGWSTLMAKTWFCHKPVKNRVPCGICHPCKYAFEEGLGYRIPLKQRVLGRLIREGVRIKKNLLKT